MSRGLSRNVRDIYFGPFLRGILEENFQWDRCGPLSQECERFFVQEACFYATRLERLFMVRFPFKILGIFRVPAQFSQENKALLSYHGGT